MVRATRRLARTMFAPSNARALSSAASRATTSSASTLTLSTSATRRGRALPRAARLARAALDAADADDFEIAQKLGTVTFRVERERDSAFTWRTAADGSAESASLTSRDVDARGDDASCVNLYAGRYVHAPAEPLGIGRAEADRGAVMLKEYKGREAAALAETEVRAYERLLYDDDVEIDVDRYGRGPGMLPKRNLPIARLVGYFASKGVDSEATSLWTVQEWHGLRRLSEYPRAKQDVNSAVKFWPPVQRVADEPKRARARFVRKAFEGCIKSVWYAHERGVAHGALDASTFLCSTFVDRSADDLDVKLINFGCSTLCTPESVVIDLKALAVTLTELVFSALSSRGPSESTSAEALRRVFVDIHELDFKRIREYCEEEPDWVEACDFLVDGGGEYWEVLRELWQAKELEDSIGVTTNAGDLALRAEYLRELLERY
jgi:hypothetical protein